jgi:hypothetical protein
MQNGICPECGGTEVYLKNGIIWGHGTSIFVRLRGLFTGTIALDVLICLQCGHTALRIPADDIDRLRADLVPNGWTRIQRSMHGK